LKERPVVGRKEWMVAFAAMTRGRWASLKESPVVERKAWMAAFAAMTRGVAGVVEGKARRWKEDVDGGFRRHDG
jgi:hypothetical protein